MGYVEFEGLDLCEAVQYQEWIDRSVKASGIGQDTFEELVTGYKDACEQNQDVVEQYLEGLYQTSYIGADKLVEDTKELGVSLVDHVAAAWSPDFKEDAVEQVSESLPAVAEDSVPGDYTWILEALGGAALIGGAVYGIKKLWDRHKNKKVIVSNVDILPGGIVLASGYYKGHSWAISGTLCDYSIKFGDVKTDYDYGNDLSYVSEIRIAVRSKLEKK